MVRVVACSDSMIRRISFTLTLHIVASPDISHFNGASGCESAKVVLRERLVADSRSAPMPTESNAELFEFEPVDRRAVVAGFDGGAITSDAGALLLGATDRAIGLVERFAQCFIDRRRAERV